MFPTTTIGPQALKMALSRRARAVVGEKGMRHWRLDDGGASFLRYRGAVRRPSPWTTGAVLLALLVGGVAQAGGHHRHGYWRGTSVGVVVGVPLGWPYYRGGFYDWPYYEVPRTVVVERAPTVYIERGSAGGETGEGWWHYCRDPEGYYPYVKKCPGGWERVAPSPSE